MKSKRKTIIYNPEWTPDGTRERYRWVENASCGLRVVGPCHDIIQTRDRHTGWYTDHYQEETVHGVVLQLPCRVDREPLYVPAVSDPNESDAFIVDFHNLECDKEDAARTADSMAEQYAEREREYQLKDAAERAIEDEGEAIGESCATLRQLVRDLHTAGHTLPPSVRDVVKLRIREIRDDTARRVHRIRELRGNAYYLLEGY